MEYLTHNLHYSHFAVFRAIKSWQITTCSFTQTVFLACDVFIEVVMKVHPGEIDVEYRPSCKTRTSNTICHHTVDHYITQYHFKFKFIAFEYNEVNLQWHVSINVSTPESYYD